MKRSHSEVSPPPGIRNPNEKIPLPNPSDIPIESSSISSTSVKKVKFLPWLKKSQATVENNPPTEESEKIQEKIIEQDKKIENEKKNEMK